MTRAHSRRPSCAARGRAKAMSPWPPQITVVVIRSAVNAAVSQARISS